MKRALLLAWLCCCGPAERQILPPNGATGEVVIAVSDLDDRPLGQPAQVFVPGRPLRLEVPSDRQSRVWAFQFPSPDEGGYDISTFGVRLGGDATLLEDPTRAWLWALDPEVDAPAWSEAPKEVPVNLGLRLETRPILDCSTLRIRAFPIPEVDRRVEQIVAIDADIVVYAIDVSDDAGDFQLGVLDHGVTRNWVPAIPLRGSVISLGFDGERIRGTTKGGDYFEADLDGVFSGIRPVSPGYPKIVSAHGLNVEHGASGLRSFDGPRIPRLVAHVQRAQITSLESITAITSTAVIQYNGQRWTVERVFDPDRENWRSIGGEGSRLMIGGTTGEVLVRSEGGGDWDFQGSPFPLGVTLQGIGPLPDHRFLVVGNKGLIGIWSASAVCDLHTYANDMLALGTAPGGRTIYVGTDHLVAVGEDHPAILQIKLP